MTYRPAKGGLSAIGIAQGPFKQKEFLQKMKLKGVKPEKYLLSFLYPMGSGMQVVFLDPTTIVFGENAALKGAIDVRDKGAESLASNNSINDLILDSDSAPIWSVLDQLGTQDMMKSALGQASSLADYDVVKKRLLASDYVMNFDNGVTFDLNVKTSDNMTAASLASLLKAGVMYRRHQRHARRETGAGKHDRGQPARPAADAFQDRRPALSGIAEIGSVRFRFSLIQVDRCRVRPAGRVGAVTRIGLTCQISEPVIPHS